MSVLELALVLLSIHAFVIVGFFSKQLFADRVHAQSFVLLSIYFFQPMLVFWGFMVRPLSWDLLQVGSVFLAVLVLGGLFSFCLRPFFGQRKDKSIVSIAGVTGNTGNVGIPLGIAFFGLDSVPYTSLMNVTAALFVFIAGTYFYSRGTYSVLDSVKNVVKLPFIWATLLAVACNYFEIRPHDSVLSLLEMGAYTAMVFQLIIFGMFLSSSKRVHFIQPLVFVVSGIKIIAMPLIAVIVLWVLKLDPFLSALICLQSLVPMANNNINLAALLKCDPDKVTGIGFVSTVLCVFVLPFAMIAIEKIFGWS